MKEIIQFFNGTILTTFVYFLGGWDIALQTLLVMIVLDTITGICKAIYNKNLNSITCAKGIVKKIGYLIVVTIAVLIDQLTNMNGALRSLIIYSFVTGEGISILENWGQMGLAFPRKLQDILEQLKK